MTLSYLSKLQDVIDCNDTQLRAEIGYLNQDVVTEYVFYLRSQLIAKDDTLKGLSLIVQQTQPSQGEPSNAKLDTIIDKLDTMHNDMRRGYEKMMNSSQTLHNTGAASSSLSSHPEYEFKSSKISLQGAHKGWYMSAQKDGKIECNRSLALGWEEITIEKHAGNWIYLKSYHGKYLSAQPNGKLEWNRDWKREWERFEVHNTTGLFENTIALKSYHGKWVSAQPKGSICVNRAVLDAWECFTVHYRDWQQLPSCSLTCVSSGSCGVWGVDRDQKISFLDGMSFQNIDGALVDISVGGSKIWGVNKSNDIYMRKGVKGLELTGAMKSTLDEGWMHVSGKLIQVSVSEKDHVWGVNSHHKIYMRAGSEWKQVEGDLKCVSVGEAGVWGVNKHDMIYYRIGTFGDVDSSGTSWKKIDGALKWISSSKNIVVGVNKNDDIYYRAGITSTNQIGSSWIKLGGKLTQIDVNEGVLWGVNSIDHVYHRKLDYERADTDEAGGSGLINVAVRKTATQSSTGWGGTPDRAVDGNTDGDYNVGSCSHTGNQSGDRWWQVDLLTGYKVYHINIYNRTKVCQKRLDQAKVYLDTYHVGTITVRDSDLDKSPYTFNCSGKFGRIVKVILSTGEHLHMAEVEVMSDMTTMDISLTTQPKMNGFINVAVGKTATQSSTGWGGTPDRAVDGNTDGDYNVGSCSHTGGQSDKTRWWQVDLEKEYKVDHINIYNRTGTCQKRIDQAKIFLDDEQVGLISVSNKDLDKSPYTFPCADRTGRIVRVVLSTGEHLHMAEVEVMTDPTTEQDHEMQGFVFKSNRLSLSTYAHSNNFVTAHPDGRIDVRSQTVGETEVFEHIRHSGHLIYLKSSRGRYLSAQSDGTLQWKSTSKGSNEQFHVKKIDLDKIGLMSHHSKWVSVQPSGDVAADGDGCNEWEYFVVHFR